MNKYVSHLDEFLNLDYKLEILPFEEDNEKGYVVKSPELKGLEVYGETVEEALSEVREAKEALYQVYSNNKTPIKYPKKYSPSAENFSGRITVRIPKTLHKRVHEYSDKNDVSLNTAMIQLLNDGLYYNESPAIIKEDSENMNKRA